MSETTTLKVEEHQSIGSQKTQVAAGTKKPATLAAAPKVLPLGVKPVTVPILTRPRTDVPPPQPQKDSMVIKTSKKWVLPPRPKPGRKPSAAQKEAQPMAKSHSLPKTHTQQNKNRAGSPSSVIVKREPRSVSPEVDRDRSKPIAMTHEPKKKSNASVQDTPKSLNVSNMNVVANPLKQAIIKVNEENYYLKLEVIKLVSDLKSLRSELMQQKKQQQPLVKQPVSPMSVLNEAYSHQEIRVKQEEPESPPLQSITKKRVHDDDDMNDLILSLVDLSHTSKSEDENSSDSDNDSTVTAVEHNTTITDKTHGLDHSDDDEDLESSSTPDSLLTLTKSNSSIDELELPARCSLSGVTEVDEDDMPVAWSYKSKLSPNFTFQVLEETNKHKISQRQKEREEEIAKYNVMNDLLDFTNHHSYDIVDVDLEFDSFMNGGRSEYSSDLSIF